MSNLGTYQTMVTMAKRIGSPEKLMTAVAIGGYLVIRASEAGIKTASKAIRNRITKPKKSSIGKTHVILRTMSADGITLKKGSLFKVLERDGDAVLIEVEGDNGNPYVVSADALSHTSSFN